MKRTHLASFSSRNQTQEEVTNGHDNSIIKNHYRNYEAGLIPWPPKNYTCSFCRREFRSAQALGGHMNVHRRDRAKLKQIPSWLFESNPNFNSSSSSSSSLAIPPCHEPSLTIQRSITTHFSSARFDVLEKTTTFGGLMGERENVCRREVKKSAMDACHGARCEMNLMNKRDEVMGLELEMGLKNPKQVLDLELRLGYL